MTTNFTVSLRGYDRSEVEALFTKLDAVLAAEDEDALVQARALLESAKFTTALRGYDRLAVDKAIAESLAALA
jgi:hypothetical protein